jgi:hypothetical protein
MNDDEIKDDDIEDLYMNPWLEAGIVVLITAISAGAFAFFIGYLL